MKNYYTAKEVSEILGVSISKAYQVIHQMNRELTEKGYLTVAGKVPQRYFEERWYGSEKGQCNQSRGVTKGVDTSDGTKTDQYEGC